MASERLSSSLQENLITLLAYSADNGKVIAHLVDPALFEGDYRVIAERCVEYWKEHGVPPKDHTGDLLSDILEDPANRKAVTYRRLLAAMLNLSESINEKYVMGKLRTFVRMQQIKDAIVESAERLSQQHELALSHVEEIWDNLLRARQVAFEPGITLLDQERVLAYIENRSDEFRSGIAVLDRNFIVPARGAVQVMIAPPGRGKTWYLVNIGKHALLQRKKVCHITIENSEEETAQRYYQAMFSVSKREEMVTVANIQTNSLGNVTGIKEKQVRLDFTFNSKFVYDELEQHVAGLGAKASNLIIKQFPPNQLTMSGLRAYLDILEQTEGFVPDLLILDYIGITAVDMRNPRISLGSNFIEFRGVCVERNMAGVTAHQSSKAGAEALTVEETHVAEDWSIIGSADQVMTYSQTKEERRRGLARLYITKSRTEKDKFGVLITQNYEIGQFCLDSVLLDKKYFKLLDKFDDEDSESDKDDDDDDAE